MGFGLGALASVVGSVASNVGNTVLGAYYNRKAASKSQDYAYSMTDYVNDYNTPANQMLRLKEAGLNPNLVYASGASNTSSGNQGASVIPYRPTMTLPDYLSIEQQIESIKAQQLQNKLTRKDLQVYEDTGIRPGTSPYSDLARILSDPKVVKNIIQGGKELLGYVVQGIKDSFSPEDMPGKPPKGLWYKDSKGTYTFDKDGNRINL